MSSSLSGLKKLGRGKIIAIYVLVVGFCIIGNLFFSPQKNYALLSQNGITTSGVIKSLDCNSPYRGNGGTFIYSFEANHKTYLGRGHSEPEIDCEKLIPGETIALTYLPTDPSVSYYGNIQKETATSSIETFIVVPIFFAVVLWFFSRSNPTQKIQEHGMQGE